ncbi:MAG: ABC transporter substrate-binding protein [Kyrpidia sp.]|nr:ABC transporter substrate-binding protein [Kyrpidia sp.]
MRQIRQRWAAVALAAEGCGREAGPAPGGGGGNAPGGESEYTLNVGYSASLGTQLGFIAEYEGFFKKQHLRINFVPFQTTADGLNALQAGKIDVGVSFGTAGPLTFISKGSDFAIIGGHLEGGSPIVARKEDADKYKTLADFKGKKIGSIRLYTGDIVFRSALHAAGIDWKKDLEIIEFKNQSLLLEAVKSGKVDAGVAAPGSLAAVKEAGLVVVNWSNQLQPGHVCCRVVAKRDQVRQNAEPYKRFLKALIEAERVKQQNPGVTIAASAPHVKLDEHRIGDTILEPHQINSSDPNKKEVLKMWKEMKDIGYLDNPSVDIAQYVETDLYRQAVDELIAEHPGDPYYQKIKERFLQQNT